MLTMRVMPALINSSNKVSVNHAAQNMLNFRCTERVTQQDQGRIQDFVVGDACAGAQAYMRVWGRSHWTPVGSRGNAAGQGAKPPKLTTFSHLKENLNKEN